MEWNDIRQLKIAASTVLEQLIWDEYLIKSCEAGQIGPSIRTWVADHPTVVLGYSNRLEQEVFVDNCLERRIPILRRTSGGGTVLLDQGCLNYSLVFPVSFHDSMASVGLTNQYIMNKQCSFLSGFLDQQVELQGFTDLVVSGRKVVGNAQRRTQSAVLFHGSFLCSADLDLISQVLRCPSRQPEYRKGRGHLQFINNLGVSVSDLSQGMLSYWAGNKKSSLNLMPDDEIWASCSRRLKAKGRLEHQSANTL